MVCRGDFDCLCTQVSVGLVLPRAIISSIATERRAVSHEYVPQSRESRSKGDEPDIWVRGRGETQTRRANVQGMSYLVVRSEHPSQSQSFSSFFAMCLRHVWRSPVGFAWISSLTASLVPLATLVSATQRPAKVQNAILSPDGLKRYFVTHGGLFSKDGVTLDEIRKIKRIGRQPGTEGLMCTFLFMFLMARDLTCINRRGLFFKPFTIGGRILSSTTAPLDGPTGITRMGTK